SVHSGSKECHQAPGRDSQTSRRPVRTSLLPEHLLARWGQPHVPLDQLVDTPHLALAAITTCEPATHVNGARRTQALAASLARADCGRLMVIEAVHAATSGCQRLPTTTTDDSSVVPGQSRSA